MASGVLMLIASGGAVVLALLLVGWLGGLGAHQFLNRSAQTALQILEKRYAAGEIGEREYEKRRAMLLASSS